MFYMTEHITCASECTISFSSLSKRKTAYTSFSSFSIRSLNFRITSDTNRHKSQSKHSKIESCFSQLRKYKEFVFSWCNLIVNMCSLHWVSTLRNNTCFNRSFGFSDNLFQHLSLAFPHQRHRTAHFSCSRRAAHSVHVMLQCVWHGEVYNLRKIVNFILIE